MGNSNETDIQYNDIANYLSVYYNNFSRAIILLPCQQTGPKMKLLVIK